MKKKERCPVCNKYSDEKPGKSYCVSYHKTCPICKNPRPSKKCKCFRSIVMNKRKEQ